VGCTSLPYYLGSRDLIYYLSILLLAFFIVEVVIRSISFLEQTFCIPAMPFLSLIIIFLIGTASHVVAELGSNGSLLSPPKATSSTTPHNTSPKLVELISLAPSLTDDLGFATGEGFPPAPYWLEDIRHQGISAFNSDPDTYQVFRNVKSFGAKGV
jgi:hypothetical protein